MKKVRLHDKEFQVSIEAAAIDREIERVAGEINRDLQGERPLFLSILFGAYSFKREYCKRTVKIPYCRRPILEETESRQILIRSHPGEIAYVYV